MLEKLDSTHWPIYVKFPSKIYGVKFKPRLLINFILAGFETIKFEPLFFFFYNFLPNFSTRILHKPGFIFLAIQIIQAVFIIAVSIFNTSFLVTFF